MAAVRQRRRNGFTLVEALVAIAILAFVVVGFLGVRTSAMADAAESRNLRVARDVAHAKLSELEAGALEIPPTSGERLFVDGYEKFEYAFFIGEAEIAEAEQELAGDVTDDETYDRLEWQRERDLLRGAERRGMSVYDYEDELLAEDAEPRPPSESEYEDVAIMVYYPNIRLGSGPRQLVFTLKRRISTAAIDGLTPERAQTVADSMGADMATGNRHPNAALPAGSSDQALPSDASDPGLGGGR